MYQYGDRDLYMIVSDDVPVNAAGARGDTDIDRAASPPDVAHADIGHGAQAITVLLVDDSKTIRRSASSFLTAAGYSVISAVDGFDALSKVVEHRPSMVFVDIMMPRLDGYQTCALIKNNADFRDIPVVMLSSKDGLFDNITTGMSRKSALFCQAKMDCLTRRERGSWVATLICPSRLLLIR